MLKKISEFIPLENENSKLGPISWSKWKPGSTPDEIIGEWFEDFSHYKMIVPYQLRDSIILLQNIFVDRVAEVENSAKEYNKAIENINKFFGG